MNMNMNQFGNPMMNNMNNMNMGMNNMGMPMNMGMNNMGMPMNIGIPMNMMGTGMIGMNVGGNADTDDDWMSGFRMGVEEVNNPGNDDSDLNSPGPKMNLIFTTTQGTKRNLVVNYGTTIAQALRKYLREVGKSDLENSDKISFLYNAAKLDFTKTDKVEDYFKNLLNPKIVVNDTNNLIGA